MRAEPASAGLKQISRIADDYRAAGYEVVVGPTRDQLPPPLKDASPDLLVRRGDEYRIIEVKSRWAHDGSALRKLAEAVRSQPGWALDVIVTGRERKPWTLREVRRRVKDARELVEAGHHEAALLLGWSALEAVLRHYAAREKIKLEREDPPYLLKRLATEGDLSREEFQKLASALEVRNALAHGHRAVEFERSHVEDLLAIAEAWADQMQLRTKSLETVT